MSSKRKRTFSHYPDSTSDPLLRLDPSTTLEILYHLPLRDLVACQRVSQSWDSIIDSYATSIYHNLAPSILDLSRYKRLQALDDASQATRRYAMDESLVTDGKVDWRAAVIQTVMEEKNWKNGRAKTRWITPGSNAVWRQKIDPEEQVIYSVSRIGGISSHTLFSPGLTPPQELLFEYAEVAPYAHLEFTQGYLIFNLEHHYEVHLTPPAFARLSEEERQRLPDASQSETSGYGWSQFGGLIWNTKPGEVPRGHLTFYRTIHTPSDCFAFRARTDREGTDEERPMVGFAGPTHAYIYSLADENYVETYSFADDIQDSKPNYIEFDDDFVFICGDQHVHTYSRQTRTALAAFPEKNQQSYELELSYKLLPGALEATPLLPQRGDEGTSCVPGEKPARTGRARLEGQFSGDLEFDNEWQRRLRARTINRNYSFNACHYTSKDLFFTNKIGALYVLRWYKQALSIVDPAERARAIRLSLIVLDLGSDVTSGLRKLHQLTTCGEKVVFNTGHELYMLNTSSLPPPPYIPWRTLANPPPFAPIPPPISILSLLDVHRNGLRHSSSLQMDERTIYLVYWAPKSVREGGREDRLAADVSMDDFGMCVKVWDFGWEDGSVGGAVREGTDV
ncbi:hypothetical protein IAR50_007085 [Cryptococcus sp. DSM 104548]